MPESPVHLVVGTPCYAGQVTSAYFSSVLKLQEACQRDGIALSFLMPDGEDLVQRARQEIVADFMEIPGATHLLFIDSDIAFEPEQAFRLMGFNADVTAAAYPLKTIDWEKVRAGVEAGWEKLESSGLHYVLEPAHPVQVRDAFVRAVSTGTGFLLVKRGVFTSLMDRHPELRYSRKKGQPGGSHWAWALFNCLIDGKDGPFLSEDYSFCRRWTGMGGEIWVDLNSRLRHLGQAVFEGDLNSGPAPSPKAGGRC